jgi:hypothetical protein
MTHPMGVDKFRLRRFSWGNGISVNRDCAGNCFVGFETNLGDRVCDNGEAGTSSLECRSEASSTHRLIASL